MAVAESAGYAYLNTDPACEQEPRMLAAHFITTNTAVVQKDPGAGVLMAGGVDSVTDLVAELCRRLVGPKVGS